MHISSKSNKSNSFISNINIKNLKGDDPFLDKIYFQKVPYMIKDKQVEQIGDQYFNPLNLFQAL